VIVLPDRQMRSLPRHSNGATNAGSGWVAVEGPAARIRTSHVTCPDSHEHPTSDSKQPATWDTSCSTPARLVACRIQYGRTGPGPKSVRPEIAGTGEGVPHMSGLNAQFADCGRT
jgi:hypothetical protein